MFQFHAWHLENPLLLTDHERAHSCWLSYFLAFHILRMTSKVIVYVTVGIYLMAKKGYLERSA